MKKVIQTYINEQKKHVEQHLTDKSKPIGDLMNSLNIKVNMEKISWWKIIPANPDQQTPPNPDFLNIL